MAKLKLIDAPRLYVPAEFAENPDDYLTTSFLKSAAKRVLKDADWLARTEPIREGEASSYLAGSRVVQSHLDCLTCAWVLTRKMKYRKAAMKHLGNLMNWNHISCEARANTPPEKDMPFCLSYGEQSMSIGLMYDHFRPDLNSEESRIFNEVIDRFHLKMALVCVESPMWWVNKAWSNWNGVCSGGMGVLGLSFYEDRPEAQELIPFVEGSLKEYFSSYIENGGGCHEGTGYWNYGMNYAMRYVLSYEHATGRPHQALKIKELGDSLNFPIDFTGITFGDNDGWGPTAFFFLLAKRLNQHHAACRAAAYLPEQVDLKAQRREKFAYNGDLLYAAQAIPTPEVMKRLEAAHAKRNVPVARIYSGMDWGVLADDEAFPTMRMAVRGGSAKVMGHGMTDLLSFRCRVNDELFITDQNEKGYLTTTFGKRGGDLYSRSPESKSTLFVDGLGCSKDASCEKTEVVSGRGLSGIRIDATNIYLERMRAQFIGRLFLFVDHAYWLIVDHCLSDNEVVELAMESRFHTYADYRLGRSHVALKSGKQTMQLSFAALEPAVLQQSRGMPAQPAAGQTHIFRFLGKNRVHDNFHVTALLPGHGKAQLKLSKPKGDTYAIDVARPDQRNRRIKLTSDLQLA